MVYRMIVFAVRKEGVSTAEFRRKYESHIRLIHDIMGDAAPVYHIRRYIQETPDGKPVVFMGNADEINFHAIVEVAYESETAFRDFYAKYQGEAKERIQADEDTFLDMSKFKVVMLGEVDEWTKA